MTREDATKALGIFSKLDELKKFRETAESYYATAQISADNTAGVVRILKIGKDLAIAIVADQIAQQEAALTALGFDRE